MSGSNLASSASAGHPRRFLRQGRTRHTLARRNRVAMPARAAHQGVVAAVPRPRGHGRRRCDGRRLGIIVIEPGRRGPGMRPRHARAGSRRLRKGNESHRRRRLPGRGRGGEREGGAGERGHRSGERIGRRDRVAVRLAAAHRRAARRRRGGVGRRGWGGRRVRRGRGRTDHGQDAQSRRAARTIETRTEPQRRRRRRRRRVRERDDAGAEPARDGHPRSPQMAHGNRRLDRLRRKAPSGERTDARRARGDPTARRFGSHAEC
mmetsp:Transcript_3575/g.16421  ORF Transcript_3575/g.16421 Transcript_3575/m.16421 type:complete len:263 (+) Transcript_3575:177-965(+)